MTKYTSPAAADGPFLEVAYCYDGTLEGLLSAIFAAYERHEDPTDVTPRDRLQPRLGQRVADIPTDLDHALRVRRGLCRKCGAAAFEAVRNASLSDDPDAGTAAYRFVRYALPPRGHRTVRDDKECDDRDKSRGRSSSGSGSKGQGDSSSAYDGGSNGRGGGNGGSNPRPNRNPLSDLTHPAVEPLVRISRAVANERHRMMQFLRFEHLEGGVWFARCRPNANVVPLLMDWFSARFNTQPFVIYDEAHHVAGVYEGLHGVTDAQEETPAMTGGCKKASQRPPETNRIATGSADATRKGVGRHPANTGQTETANKDALCEGSDWYLVATNRLNLPSPAADEKAMQQAWKRFYRSVSVESRYHPELRRQFMPKRLWENITEMQEDFPERGFDAQNFELADISP